MRAHDEFVVETDKAGEAPMPFWSETVRRVVVEWHSGCLRPTFP